MSSNNKKKLSKKNIIIIGIVAAALVIAIGIGVWYFCFSSGSVGKGATIDISADTTGFLVPAEQVISGGPAQEMADKFDGEFSDAVMTVNGEPVDAGIMRFAVNDYGMRYARSLMMTGAIGDTKNFDWNVKDPNYNGTYLEYVKFWSVEDFVPRYALIAEGKRRGITLTEAEKNEAADWSKEQQGDMSDKEFEKVLKENGCPDIATFIAFREFSMLEAKVYEDFEKNPEKYATREQLLAADERELVTVKHILIAFDPQSTGNVTDQMKADTKKRAEDVLSKVKAGVEFDNLIAEYNDDPGATEDGYTFADDGTMVQEFTDASFALQVGETSGLVETTYGYHIIKRLDRAVTITDYLILLNKNAKVKINKSIFDNLTVEVDMKTYFDSVMQSMIGG